MMSFLVLHTVTSVYDLPVEGVRMEGATLAHIEQCMARNVWSLAYGHNDDMKAAPSTMIASGTASCLWLLGTPLMMSLLLTVSGGSVRHADCKDYPASSWYPFKLIERHGDPFATWRPFASFVYFFSSLITVGAVANMFALMAQVSDYMYPNYAAMALCKEAGWIPVSAESTLFYNGTFMNVMTSTFRGKTGADLSGAADFQMAKLSWYGTDVGTPEGRREFYEDAWIWQGYMQAMYLRVILIAVLAAAVLGYGNFFTTGGNDHGKEGSVYKKFTTEEKLDHDLALVEKRSGSTKGELQQLYMHDLVFLDSVLKESGINNILHRMQIINLLKTDEKEGREAQKHRRKSISDMTKAGQA
jgi:hypothetical protein